MTQQHNLFPFDGSETEGQKAMPIDSIHVRRLEGGKFVYAPQVYEASALESIEQLYGLYGGGDYILEARDADKKFCRTRRLQLPGPAKPLQGSLDPGPTPAAVQHAPERPLSEAALMMTMMDRMMTMSMQQSQQQTALILGILNKGEAGNAQLADRRAELERQARMEHNDFLQKMLEHARAGGGGGGGDQDGFFKGIEFAQGMFSEMMERQAQQSDAPEDFMSSVSAFMQGIGAIAKNNTGTGGGGAGNGSPGADAG